MSTIMNAETGLPPLPERFDYTNSSAYWCYSRYTMTRDDLGDYVLAEDYDALRNASEALQAEIEALRAEVEVWKASFEQAAAGHATYAERAERLAKVLRLAEEHISAMTPECYRAGQRVLAAIRAVLEQEERK